MGASLATSMPKIGDLRTFVQKIPVNTSTCRPIFAGSAGIFVELEGAQRRLIEAHSRTMM